MFDVIAQSFRRQADGNPNRALRKKSVRTANITAWPVAILAVLARRMTVSGRVTPMLLRMTDIGNRGAATSRVLEVAEAVSRWRPWRRSRASSLRWVPPPCPSSSRICRDALLPGWPTSLARSTGDSEAAVGVGETSRNPRCCCPSTAVRSSRHSATSSYGCFPGPVLRRRGAERAVDGARAGDRARRSPRTAEMSLPGEPHLDTLSEIARTAHLLGFVVIANRRHTDLFEWGQRSTPFTLPAEIRRLLPAYTCEGGAFTLSAWLEPRRTSVATPSTTASAATCCTCQSRMRWVTAWLAPDRHLVRGEPAQHAPPGCVAARTGGRRQRRPVRTPPVSPTTRTPPASLDDWSCAAVRSPSSTLGTTRPTSPAPVRSRLFSCLPACHWDCSRTRSTPPAT